MKTKLLRKLRKKARKEIYIVAPAFSWKSYCIQREDAREPIYFYCQQNFNDAEARIRFLRRNFIRNIIHSYKKNKERNKALERINRFTF